MNNNNANKRNLMIIHNRDGSEEVVEVILAFRFNDTGREFIIYTKNEIDKDGDEFIYVSEKFYGPDNEVELQDISDDDLPRIENLLRKIAESEDDESSNTISPDSDGIERIAQKRGVNVKKRSPQIDGFTMLLFLLLGSRATMLLNWRQP